MFQKYFTDLESRGLVYQTSKGLETDEISGIYLGIDPTGPSLHIGHLIGVLSVLKASLQYKIPSYFLLGQATAQIGDPSGKTGERSVIPLEELDANSRSLKAQLETMMDNCLTKKLIVNRTPSEYKRVEVLNNLCWMEEINCVDFLRNVGRHFRVGTMLSRESVKRRLFPDASSIATCKDSVTNSSAVGLGYHEFSYMIFQAYDFYYLWKNMNVNLQVGGQDQWGNMSSGLDLIEKKSKILEDVPRSKDDTRILQPHLLTYPLLTTASGEKFGKSEGNAVWLDAAKTSEYDLYQHFLKCPDSLVEKYLKIFTFIPIVEIEAIMDLHRVGHLACRHLYFSRCFLGRSVTIYCPKEAC